VAQGEFAGFFGEGGARQGLGRVTVSGAAGPVCHGHGAFMALAPPPGMAMHPVPERPRTVPDLAEGDLTAEERAILAHADAVLADGTADFLRRLWGLEARRSATGAIGRMRNGAHVANRVHHVQGGLMMAFAAASAAAALPPRWALTGIASCFVSPGQGTAIRARSKVVHHGLMTGVVRTELTGTDRRRILETTTTHSRLAAPA
jgi:acyl-coenzyme A thioesterase PaaI-like protein